MFNIFVFVITCLRVVRSKDIPNTSPKASQLHPKNIQEPPTTVPKPPKNFRPTVQQPSMFFQKPAIENEENLRHCKYLVESPAHSKDILENNCVGN